MHAPLESQFRVEWRPLSALSSIVPQWRELSVRALEPNIFYEPAFALAAAGVFGRDVGVGLVWSRTTPERLVGFFPARLARRRYGVRLPVLVGWTHPYGPFGAPLLDHEAGEAVIGAWLDHLARDARLPSIMLMRYCPVEGSLARALDGALERRGGRSILFGRHARAQVAPGTDRLRYSERALDRKKLKELRRQLRRLGEAGIVTWRIASDAGAVAQAMGDFLHLEASGWKGRADTAASGKAEIRFFVETAVAQLAREGKARVAALFLDDRAIASLVLLQSADTIWTWKIAYDETFARVSPGVQLILHATKTLLEDPACARIDSCAAPGHPMIDHLWCERLRLADQLIRIGPAGSAAFGLAAALEAGRRAAFVTARRAQVVLRRWRRNASPVGDFRAVNSMRDLPR